MSYRESEGDPDYIPYTKYRMEADALLKEFALNYRKDDHAGCHTTEKASALSHQISLFARVHWHDEFKENQYPWAMRKPFKAYEQDGNN